MPFTNILLVVSLIAATLPSIRLAGNLKILSGGTGEIGHGAKAAGAKGGWSEATSIYRILPTNKITNNLLLVAS